MPGFLHKLFCRFLVLALALAPMEFALAHVSGSIHGVHQMQSQPAAPMVMPTVMADAGHCQSQQNLSAPDAPQPLCKDCVYCSPAISNLVWPGVDIPHIDLQPLQVSARSVSLPLEDRPPKTLSRFF